MTPSSLKKEGSRFHEIIGASNVYKRLGSYAHGRYISANGWRDILVEPSNTEEVSVG